MNWKQFLKPTKWKIIILILVLLPSLITWICILFDCKFLPSWFILFLNLSNWYTAIQFPISLIFKILGIPYDVIIPRILDPFINLIYWYFLSCLIVWIYDKLKKKFFFKKEKVSVSRNIVDTDTIQILSPWIKSYSSCRRTLG